MLSEHPECPLNISAEDLRVQVIQLGGRVLNLRSSSLNSDSNLGTRMAVLW